jgi:hypothetical protein
MNNFSLSKFSCKYFSFCLVNCSTPESHTYKILHVPLDMHYYEKDKVDNISSDHGYHESYQTGSSSSSSSPEQCSGVPVLIAGP